MLLSQHPIKEVLKNISIESCPYDVNFHCHTTFSDGSLDPEELISRAVQLGLHHIAVTDHHSLKAIPVINNWLREYNNVDSSLVFWSGIEISCILNGCLVHILGLGIDTNSEYLHPYIQGESVQGVQLQAKEVIKAINNSNGISILAHPARYRIDFATLIERAFDLGIDGIEVWYDYEFNKTWKPSKFICESIDKLTTKYKLIKSCGTDSHGYSLLGR